jgi:hypothetical protein
MKKAENIRKAGRPVSRARKADKRVAVGLQISVAVKNALVRIAEREKIGFSRAAEMAFERAFVLDEFLARMGRFKSIEELDLDQTRAALLRKGWTVEHGYQDGLPRWRQPDPSRGPQFGFVREE